jgi:hypothetical protein
LIAVSSDESSTPVHLRRGDFKLAGGAGSAFCFGAERHGRTATLPHVTAEELGAPCLAGRPNVGPFGSLLRLWLRSTSHLSRSNHRSEKPHVSLARNIGHPPPGSLSRRTCATRLWTLVAQPLLAVRLYNANDPHKS